jgi:putative ABC transport system permease protein
MMFDFLIYSFNSLRARKTRTLLTMVGIFIGIAAVVSLISLGNGFQNAVFSQFSDLGADMLTIQAAETGFGPPGSTALKLLSNQDFEAVKKTKGVEVVAKRYIRAVSMKFKDKSLVLPLSSLPLENEARDLIVTNLNLEVEEGRLLKKEDKFKVILGNNFHSSEKFDRVINNGDKVELNGIEFEVVGILEKLGNPQFNEIVLVNEDVLKNVLGIEDEMDLIVAKVVSVNSVDSVARDIEKALRKTRSVEEGKEDFSVESPQKILESLNTVLDVIAIVLIGIAAISLVVGGIGIMNTMYTAVLERTKEIGIMKSIGARNSDVLMIFLVESGILGLVGGLIGVILGISFSKLVEIIAANAGFSIIKISFPFSLIIGTLVFSFVVGALSGIVPAYKASKLKPVDALRYE